ncbi:MAG: GspH/FimT family pseudopilin [Gammaproteobacteria bacterium]|nr:GspH/FimT family pseudopilin [Gammaproteobacteria bacterium]MDH3507298.1 GspH/FimT family pseudopilin [Gammaproteobacteria bacterium]
MRCSPAQCDEAAWRDSCRRSSRGYTLLELVVATSILAVLAAIALPSLSAGESERLDLAAGWIAETARFARAEALRTGNPVYLEIDRDTERLRVAVADLSGSTAAPGTILRDPITKQQLDVILSDMAATASIDVTDEPFDYPSGGRQPVVVFDAQGLPFIKSSDAFQLLESGNITLERGGQQRIVRVSPLTGRVTIQ